MGHGAATKAERGVTPGSTAGPGTGGKAGTAADTEAARAAAERAYLSELQRAISRFQRFPEEARKGRKTGIVTVSFVLQADGRIRQVAIAKSSGDPSLDQAALEALHRLDRFKPIPAAIGRGTWSMRVPIRFDLR